MGQFTHQGVIYEELPDGQVRVVGHAPTSQLPIGVPTRGADPLLPARQTQASNAAAASALDPELARLRAEQLRIANEKARSAAPRGAMTQKQVSDIKGDENSLNTLERGIENLETQYTKSFAGKGPGALAEYLPGAIRPENKVFDTQSEQLSAFIAKALGLSGQQFNTPAEQKLFVGSYLPSSSDPDEVIQSKIGALRGLLSNAREGARVKLGQPESPPAAGIDNAQVALTAEPTRYENDPALAGVRQRYADMLRQNRPYEEIAGFLTNAGVTNPGVLASVQKQVEFRKANPNIPIERYSTGAIDDRAIPQTPMRQFMSGVGGSPLGTGIISAGNAVTGFNLPRLTDNPELTRAGIANLEEQNPRAALAGTLAGGVGAGLGLEAGLGAAGMARGAAIFAPRALTADALYGGTSGYGLGGEDAGLEDVAGGIVAGLGGGIAGRGIVGGLAGGVGPTGGGAAPLYQQGVRPTPGQRFGKSGMFGRALNTVEQALQSVPFAGSAVAGARQAPRDAFETGGFNRALGEIGQGLPEDIKYGPDAFAFTRKAFNNTYDQARSGMQFVPDSQFTQDLGDFQRNVLGGGLLDSEGVKQVKKVVGTTLGSRLQSQGGALSGDVYKKTISDLRNITKNTSKPEVRNAITDITRFVEDAARRNSNPDAVALLDKADRGYAQYVPLKEAARMAGNDTGRFTPGNLASVERRSMGKTNAFLEGNTLMGDYINAGKMLTDTLPNSGTGERLMTGQLLGGGALGGAGTVSPLIPAGAVAATIPYMPGVRSVVGAALAPSENATRNAIAGMLRRRQVLGGMFGAPLALDYSAQ